MSYYLKDFSLKTWTWLAAVLLFCWVFTQYMVVLLLIIQELSKLREFKVILCKLPFPYNIFLIILIHVLTGFFSQVSEAFSYVIPFSFQQCYHRRRGDTWIICFIVYQTGALMALLGPRGLPAAFHAPKSSTFIHSPNTPSVLRSLPSLIKGQWVAYIKLHRNQRHICLESTSPRHVFLLCIPAYSGEVFWELSAVWKITPARTPGSLQILLWAPEGCGGSFFNASHCWYVRTAPQPAAPSPIPPTAIALENWCFVTVSLIKENGNTEDKGT